MLNIIIFINNKKLNLVFFIIRISWKLKNFVVELDNNCSNSLSRFKEIMRLRIYNDQKDRSLKSIKIKSIMCNRNHIQCKKECFFVELSKINHKELWTLNKLDLIINYEIIDKHKRMWSFVIWIKTTINSKNKEYLRIYLKLAEI